MFDRIRQHGRRVVEGEQITDGFLETCPVRHYFAQGDRPAAARRHLGVEIAVHIRIEIELPLLHQLHHGGPSEEL